MKNILVPCDFSRPAIDAFRFAIDLAEETNATVHLLHIIEVPVVSDSLLMPVVHFERQFFDELKDSAQKRFNKITSKYVKKPVNIISDTQFGKVSLMIRDYITDKAIDLVAMGSHGASGARELFIGSNAEKVTRNSPVPVLVMKAYHKGPIKNIVFPNTLDYEEQENLINRVKELQRLFKAKLHIVWVNTPLNFASDNVTIKRLQSFVKRYDLKDCTINVFNYPDEEGGIVQFANSIKADMIAIGTHGRKGLGHLLIGSLAEDVVNHHKGLVWTYAFKNNLVEAN